MNQYPNNFLVLEVNVKRHLCLLPSEYWLYRGKKNNREKWTMLQSRRESSAMRGMCVGWRLQDISKMRLWKQTVKQWKPYGKAKWFNCLLNWKSATMTNTDQCTISKTFLSLSLLFSLAGALCLNKQFHVANKIQCNTISITSSSSSLLSLLFCGCRCYSPSR